MVLPQQGSSNGRKIALLLASVLTLTSLSPFFSRIPDFFKKASGFAPLENFIQWKPFANFQFFPIRLILLTLLLWQTGQSLLFAIIGAIVTTLIIEGLNAWELRTSNTVPISGIVPSSGVVPPSGVVPTDSAISDLLATERQAEAERLNRAIVNAPQGAAQGLNPLVVDYGAAQTGNPAIGHRNPYLNK